MHSPTLAISVLSFIVKVLITPTSPPNDANVRVDCSKGANPQEEREKKVLEHT